MEHIELEIDVLEAMRGRDVYVSLSGGGDSLALALTLCHYHGLGFFSSLRAVHFEHGFRGAASLEDAAYCERFCEKESIPFTLFHLDVPSHAMSGEGDEEAARRLRFEKWHELLSGAENAVIALGHNSGDRIENYLLRAMRGSNVTGLTAMRKIQTSGRLLLVRPLLGCTKRRIESFLSDSGVTDWRHDSTNDENIYSRNFLRNDVLPRLYSRFPFAEGGFTASLSALEQDADFIEKAAFDAFENKPSSEWVVLHPAVLVRVMRLYLSRELGHDFIPDARFMKRLSEAFAAGSSEPLLMPLKDSSAFLALTHDGFSIVRHEKSDTVKDVKQWRFRETPEILFAGKRLRAELKTCSTFDCVYSADLVCFDESTLPCELTLELFSGGETMIPFGSVKPKSLKKIFTDAKIGSLARSSYPLLKTPDGITIWVCGLRRSSFAPVDASTRTVAVFTVEDLHD